LHRRSDAKYARIEPHIAGNAMLKINQVPVDDIYIPLERRKLLDADKARSLAEDILEHGMKLPIMVRFDGKRHIIVEGLHRLEAARILGEKTISAYLVQAKKH
jgi:ParB-like chromosome segregation protein Spo0J